MLSWTLHQKGSPKHHVQAAVAVRHELYSFGMNSEENNEDQMEVQVFNTLSLRWKKLTPRDPLEVPSGRSRHTAVLVGGIIYIWGGYGMKPPSYDYHNVLRAFDVDTHTWSTPRVSGTVPEVRWNHSACVLGKDMFIQGGQTQAGFTNDIYKLDTSSFAWTSINTRGTLAWVNRLPLLGSIFARMQNFVEGEGLVYEARGTPPPALICHSATIIGTKMFVFGGWDWDQYHNTIRVFDTETNNWLDTAPAQPLPEERMDHSAFTYNGELYIFAGCNNVQTFNGLQWKFSPQTFSWKKVEPRGKGPHMMEDMCCCMVGDRVILFGHILGVDGIYKSSGDLHVLDFSPSLKTLCKLAVVQYGLDQSELPHDIRWELAAMTTSQ